MSIARLFSVVGILSLLSCATPPPPPMDRALSPLPMGSGAPGLQQPPMGSGAPGLQQGVPLPMMSGAPGLQQPPMGSAPGLQQPPMGSAPGYQLPPMGSGAPGWQQPPLGSAPGWQQLPMGSAPGWQQPPMGSAPGWQQAPVQPVMPGWWTASGTQQTPLNFHPSGVKASLQVLPSMVNLVIVIANMSEQFEPFYFVLDLGTTPVGYKRDAVVVFVQNRTTFAISDYNFIPTWNHGATGPSYAMGYRDANQDWVLNTPTSTYDATRRLFTFNLTRAVVTSATPDLFDFEPNCAPQQLSRNKLEWNTGSFSPVSGGLLNGSTTNSPVVSSFVWMDVSCHLPARDGTIQNYMANSEYIKFYMTVQDTPLRENGVFYAVEFGKFQTSQGWFKEYFVVLIRNRTVTVSERVLPYGQEMIAEATVKPATTKPTTEVIPAIQWPQPGGANVLYGGVWIKRLLPYSVEGGSVPACVSDPRNLTVTMGEVSGVSPSGFEFSMLNSSGLRHRVNLLDNNCTLGMSAPRRWSGDRGTESSASSVPVTCVVRGRRAAATRIRSGRIRLPQTTTFNCTLQTLPSGARSGDCICG